MKKIVVAILMIYSIGLSSLSAQTGDTINSISPSGALALAGGASMLASIRFSSHPVATGEKQVSYLKMNQLQFHGNYVAVKILFQLVLM